MTPSPNRRKDPSTPSAVHLQMADRIKLANTLMDGTDGLRAEGEAYLPRYSAESENNYRDRLSRSTLTNYFRRSVVSLVGKPFATPIILGDDMPQELKDLSEDIDRQGNNIDVFSRKLFQDALVKGLTHFLVEYPNSGDIQNLEQERSIGNQPYFVHIPPESIIAAYCEYRNGQEFLTHVRIYEQEIARDGFEETTIERIRVLEPGTWKLYRKEGKKWAVESQGLTTIDFIPLVTFYADREEFMVARSPLLDLAHLNIAHWQSSSDQRNILTVTRFPMLAASGLNEEEAQVKVGPRQLLSCISKDGKFYYVEHTGATIAAGRQDLEDLKDEMSILGIELLKKSGNPTATAKAIDTAENLSMLQSLVLLFSDALEQGYKIAAFWKGLITDLTTQSGGTVKISADFGLSLDGSDLASLQWARGAKEISHQTFVSELQRRQVLSDDFDVAEDETQLKSEADASLAEESLRASLGLDAPAKPTPNQTPKPPGSPLVL